MPFEIMTRGAAISVELRDTDTRPLLKSGFCQRLEELLPTHARDPEIYGMVLKPVPSIDQATDAPTAAEQIAGARLAWRLECYSKPTVSLIDVPISGYLAGLVMNGTHRAAGEGYRLSVHPADLLHAADGGLAHWLSHLKPGIGAYLVATGRTIGGAEALRRGLVTHIIPAARFGEIETGLADADPIDPLLDDRHAAPEATSADRVLDAVIEEAFASCRLDDILARLKSVAGTAREEIGRQLLAEVGATAAGGHLADALAVLLKASRTDMRTTMTSQFKAANPDAAPLALPTRAQHQTLRSG